MRLHAGGATRQVGTNADCLLGRNADNQPYVVGTAKRYCCRWVNKTLQPSREPASFPLTRDSFFGSPARIGEMAKFALLYGCVHPVRGVSGKCRPRSTCHHSARLDTGLPRNSSQGILRKQRMKMNHSLARKTSKGWAGLWNAMSVSDNKSTNERIGPLFKRSFKFQ